MRLVILAAVFAGLAVPAAAQTRLPRKSPAERQVNRINRDLRQGGSERHFEQQYQIDTNQLRQNLDRERVFSNPTPPAGFRGTCPAGSIGC